MKYSTIYALALVAILLAACSPAAPAAAPTTAEPPVLQSIQSSSPDSGAPGATPLQSSIQSTPTEEESSAVESPAPLADILGNLTYEGIFPDRGVTLADGIAYYEEPGSGHPFVLLADRLIPTGDLNGDGIEDAVALLVDYTTGSGSFVYLDAVLDVWGEPAPTEALLVGDRIPVKSLAVDGAQVIAELIAPGPGDPACCPSWNTHRVFALEDGRLVERSSTELGKVSLGDLSGTNWRLVDLNQDKEPVQPGSEITLHIENDHISGSAGCNPYTSLVTGDENLPQVFVVSPVSAGAARCADPISQQERVYLDRLARVVSWRYDFGDLALTYKLDDGVLGELLYTPQGP